MEDLVLVIDSNTAVQAICAAALSPLGLKVETVPLGKTALGIISSLEPKAILIAADVQNVDPLELAASVRKNSSLSHIRLILLAPSEASEELIAQANSAGIDEILRKPFKSNQLRKLVEKLLAEAPKASTSATAAKKKHSSDTFALLIQDSLTRAVLVRLLEKWKSKHRIYTDPEELQKEISKNKFIATIADERIETAKTWYYTKDMGPLIVISSEEVPAEQLPQDTLVVHPPLYLEKLRMVLAPLVDAPTDHSEVNADPLSNGEQSLLAAQISAAVYQRLLTHSGLKNRKWEEACATAGAEALRICRDYKANQ